MGRYADANATLARIEEALNNGQTIYVVSYTKAVKITPATYQRWKESGRPLLKASEEYGLRMARGKGYVDANYCQIVTR